MDLNDVLNLTAAVKPQLAVPSVLAKAIPPTAATNGGNNSIPNVDPDTGEITKRLANIGQERGARSNSPNEVSPNAMTKPSLASTYSSLATPVTNSDETPPTPPAVLQAMTAQNSGSNVPAPIRNLISEPVQDPVKAKQSFGQKLVHGIETALPYVGAVAGGLEAAGDPAHPPYAAENLLRAEENAAANRLKGRELDIAQQKANTDEGYRKAYSELLTSRTNENELSPVTQDEAGILNLPVGTPMTFKEKSALFKQALQNAGGVQKTQEANKGKLAVAQLLQGAPMVIDPKLAAIAGQPQLAGQAINGKTLGNFYKTLGGLGISIKDFGDEGLWSVDKFGRRIAQVTTGSPSLERAATYARTRAEYTPEIAFDENGQPHTISALTALETGIPTETRLSGQQVFTGLPGLNIYKQSLQDIKQNLPVLQDTAQRALIAKTLRDIGTNHDPGIISAIVDSAFQEGLSPQSASLVASTLRAREFIGANRQYAGNLRGTEALYQRMAANVPGPQNSIAVNNALIDQDLNATDEIVGRLQGLGKGSKTNGASSAKEMIRVQIPGQPPGTIPKSQQQRFLKENPGAKVLTNGKQ